MPRTQLFGSGFGHRGSTSNRGACPRPSCAPAPRSRANCATPSAASSAQKAAPPYRRFDFTLRMSSSASIAGWRRPLITVQKLARWPHYRPLRPAVSGLGNFDRADHEAAADQEENRERMRPAAQYDPVSQPELISGQPQLIEDSQDDDDEDAGGNGGSFEVADLPGHRVRQGGGGDVEARQTADSTADEARQQHDIPETA